MMGDSPDSQSDSNRSFHTTRWTRIALARGSSVESRQALEELCEAYYRPVESYIRVRVRDVALAKDWTQEFFADFLKRQSMHQADREKGRFRSYLLGAVNHFLADQRKSLSRQKRGGDVTMVSMDMDDSDDEGKSLGLSDPKSDMTDEVFDREWAFTLLDRALRALQTDEEARGGGKPFEILKPWLTGEQGETAQTETAAALGLTANATKVAIHRLRKKFRQQVRNEITQTITQSCNIEEEWEYLKQVLLK
ncbi:MAG: RNA polymerase sigma factor [Verrucomicrobiota bacterium]|jgi:DNA-directed RNA polymerase specialized sigma24 family protein